MAIAVNQVSSVVAAQGVAGDIAFQPGSVIAARVIKLLPDDQVRIAIGNLAIDVQSEIQLQLGQVLQLAVSQNADGIRLTLLSQGASQSASQAAFKPGDISGGALANPNALFDTVTLAPDAAASVATTTKPTRIVLTAAEASAVSTAAQVAVTRQGGLSSLFADLGAAAVLPHLPPQLQQAVTDMLAQRPVLDAKLTGDDVQQAFRNSGLFLEASLASGINVPPGPASPATPDLKAALLVFRQLLSTALAAPATSGTVWSPPTAPVVTAAAAPVSNAAGEAVSFQQANPSDPAKHSIAETPTALQAVTSNSVHGSLQSKLAFAVAISNAGEALLPDVAASAKSQAQPRADIAIARPSIPPPPVRGALPSVQSIALATLVADAPMATTMKHLLVDTDAAIARQTLMQVASLPDRADVASARIDPMVPRWSFEIPFATPQGTAVAQFEISSDGGSEKEAAAMSQVWRARFSLDVEPAGPVHALVSLSGDKTSVRMWAERPATAQQMRAGVAQLGEALKRADLNPGDIVIREGAPLQPAAVAPAGHFLDRAL